MSQTAWKRVFCNEIEEQPCQESSVDKGDWSRKEDESKVYFVYALNGLRVIFPKFILK